MAVLVSSTEVADSSVDDDDTFVWQSKQYRLLMGADYPYASDGMLIWKALRSWFRSYLALYY